MKYDFLIRNGHVIDTAQGIDGKADVFICNSKIVPAPKSHDSYLPPHSFGLSSQ